MILAPIFAWFIHTSHLQTWISWSFGMVNGKPHLNSSSSLALQWPRQNATCILSHSKTLLQRSFTKSPPHQSTRHRVSTDPNHSENHPQQQKIAGWASMQPHTCASSKHKSTIPAGHSVIKIDLVLQISDLEHVFLHRGIWFLRGGFQGEGVP